MVNALEHVADIRENRYMLMLYQSSFIIILNNDRCPVPTCRLPLGVQGVDVHGEVQLVANDLLVLAGEFIGAVDALRVPVSPIEAVLKHRDGKRMGEA